MKKLCFLEEISMDLKTIFDGIGTEMVSVIVGLAIGTFGGYKLGVRNTIRQIQKSGSDSELYQYGIIKGEEADDLQKVSKENSIYQKQKSGDDSKQIQVGIR